MIVIEALNEDTNAYSAPVFIHTYMGWTVDVAADRLIQ
jgi:hypothetical protein